MPPFKSLDTLCDIASDALIRSLISNGSDNIVVPYLPTTVTENLISRLVLAMCDKRLGGLRDMLNCLSGSLKTGKVTRLELKHFFYNVRQKRSTEERYNVRSKLRSFKESFSQGISACKKLVYLCLETCDTMLQLCDDDVLASIGRNCNMLVYLNVANQIQITDKGLKSLIPALGNDGCPALQQLILGFCNVSPEAVASCLLKLDKISVIDYAKMDKAITLVYEHKRKNKTLTSKKLNVIIIRIPKPPDQHFPQTQFRIPQPEVNVTIAKRMNILCPNLQELKSKLRHFEALEEFSNVTKLDLYVYGGSSLHFRNARNYLTDNGSKLTSFSIEVETSFPADFILLLGATCRNLEELNVRCTTLYTDDITFNNLTFENYNIFPKLSTFCLITELTEIPVVDLLCIVLRSTQSLTYLELSVGSFNGARDDEETNDDDVYRFSDENLRYLWNNINARFLGSVIVGVPAYASKLSLLTTSSVHVILETCPLLKMLGKLSHWNITKPEIDHLKQLMEHGNYDIEIVQT